MAAGDPANLAQALAIIASAFALNQSSQSGTVAQTSASITNSPVTVAVNSVSQAGSSSTNPSFNARPSLFLHINIWDVLLYYLNRDYAAVHVLPSYLKRRRGDAVDSNRKTKRSKVIKQWDRDVTCLPPRKSDGVISFPRGKYRTGLANCGLIGKLHMTSEMDEEDMAREIRSIFKGPMKGKADFHFQYLQATGGGTKSLTVPAQSASFKWMPVWAVRHCLYIGSR